MERITIANLLFILFVQEKLTLTIERDSLLKENERLTSEQHSLQKSKDLIGEVLTRLEKALESTKKDLKERDMLVCTP